MAGRPKKVKEVVEDVSAKTASEVIVESKSTGVNGHITEKDILEKVIGDVDELAPVDGESAEHKALREIYINARNQNPIQWNNEKARLLAILKTK